MLQAPIDDPFDGTKHFAVLARMKYRNDVLVGSIFLLKGNFAEAEGLVIGYGIEYSFDEHLGEGAKENEVIANNI
jgi:hypothetical protein